MKWPNFNHVKEDNMLRNGGATRWKEPGSPNYQIQQSCSISLERMLESACYSSWAYTITNTSLSNWGQIFGMNREKTMEGHRRKRKFMGQLKVESKGSLKSPWIWKKSTQKKKSHQKNLDTTILKVAGCKTMFSLLRSAPSPKDTEEGICCTELNRFLHEPDQQSTVSMGSLPEHQTSLLYRTRQYNGICYHFLCTRKW